MVASQNMKPIDLTKVLKKYKGKWVALIPNSNEVAASGKVLKEVVIKAQDRGIHNPVMLKATPAYGPFVG